MAVAVSAPTAAQQRFVPSKHPRGRSGEFAKTAGAISLPKGVTGDHVIHIVDRTNPSRPGTARAGRFDMHQHGGTVRQYIARVTAAGFTRRQALKDIVRNTASGHIVIHPPDASRAATPGLGGIDAQMRERVAKPAAASTTGGTSEPLGDISAQMRELLAHARSTATAVGAQSAAELARHRTALNLARMHYGIVARGDIGASTPQRLAELHRRVNEHERALGITPSEQPAPPSLAPARQPPAPAPPVRLPPAPAPTPQPAAASPVKRSTITLAEALTLPKDASGTIPAGMHEWHDALRRAAGELGGSELTFAADYANGKPTSFRVSGHGVSVSRYVSSNGNVDHSFFQVSEGIRGDVGAQRRGVRADGTPKGGAKEFLAKSMEAYVKAGMKRVTVHANIDVGGYAWIRYGFEPHARYKNSLSEDMHQMVTLMQDSGRISIEQRDAVHKLLQVNDLHAVACITSPVDTYVPALVLDGTDADKRATQDAAKYARETLNRVVSTPGFRSDRNAHGVAAKWHAKLNSYERALGTPLTPLPAAVQAPPLGRTLFLNSNWYGNLDMRNVQSMKRFWSYTGRNADGTVKSSA